MEAWGVGAGAVDPATANRVTGPAKSKAGSLPSRLPVLCVGWDGDRVHEGLFYSPSHKGSWFPKGNIWDGWGWGLQARDANRKGPRRGRMV